MLPPHRQSGHGGDAGEVLQHLRRRRQQTGIAAEFIEHKAFDQLLFLRRQKRPGAIQMGKRPTPVDVSHQQAGGMAMQRHAHVDDVAARKVDLGRRACALDHHHVVFGPERVKCRRDIWPDMVAAGAPRHGREGCAHLAHQHHLAVGVGLGFQQQRVHAHLRLRLGGQRLKVLGRANLALPVDRGHHTRVVAHVLRLERGNLQPLARVIAAQRRGQPAFTCAAGGAQHHDAARGHGRLTVGLTGNRFTIWSKSDSNRWSSMTRYLSNSFSA